MKDNARFLLYLAVSLSWGCAIGNEAGIGLPPLVMEDLRNLSSSPRPMIVVFHSYTRTSKSKLLPFFKKLPQTLSKYSSQVTLHSFNCIKASYACAEQGLEKYPTLMLFSRGSKFIFKPPYLSPRLKKWINDHLFINSKEIVTESAARSVLAAVKSRETLSVVFFCGDIAHPIFPAFESVSKSRKNKEWYLYSSSQEVYRVMGCSLGDTLFVDNRGIKMNKFHTNKPFSLLRFIFAFKYRLIRLLNLFSHREFFSGLKPMVILISTSRNEEEHLSVLQKAAEESEGREEFYYIYETKHNKGLSKMVDQLLGVKPENKPCVRYVRIVENLVVKYKMDKSITLDDITGFIGKVRAGQVEPYIRSQQPKKRNKYFRVV